MCVPAMSASGLWSLAAPGITPAGHAAARASREDDQRRPCGFLGVCHPCRQSGRLSQGVCSLVEALSSGHLVALSLLSQKTAQLEEHSNRHTL
jgi:hypothetical protein